MPASTSTHAAAAPSGALRVDPRLAVLADPLRNQLLELLSVEQLCTCHLMDLTGAKQSTVSHHLKVLREAGLIEGERHGRYTYYRLCSGALSEIAATLDGFAQRARLTLDRRKPCS